MTPLLLPGRITFRLDRLGALSPHDAPQSPSLDVRSSTVGKHEDAEANAEADAEATSGSGSGSGLGSGSDGSVNGSVNGSGNGNLNLNAAAQNQPNPKPQPQPTVRRRKRTQLGNSMKQLRQHTFVLMAGLLLTFNSGFINGCCLSGMLLEGAGRGVGVAAFSGAYTQAGLALGAGDVAGFARGGRMILSFLGGACLSGLIMPRPVPHRVSQGYGPTFLLGSALLAASAALANARPAGWAFLYLAAAANGLQNSMSSMYTANLIRSTHMTGTTSDIGMYLGQTLRGNFQNTWRIVVLAGLASSFLLGGAASYRALTRFPGAALTFNACLFGAVGVGCITYTSYTRHVSLLRAATGDWAWRENDAPTRTYLLGLFDRVDHDRSGDLDVDEFAALLREAGIRMSEFGLRQVFRSATASRDGRMSRDEMLALIYCDDDGECMIV